MSSEVFDGYNSVTFSGISRTPQTVDDSTSPVNNVRPGGPSFILYKVNVGATGMTIGIGALCEKRESIVLAADKRVQISQGRFRIDDCQKIFDLPHGFFGVTAASPDAQRLVLEICLRLSRLPKNRYGLSAVERIVRQAQRQLKSLRPLHLDMQVIVAGFIDHFAFLCLVQDGLPPDFDLSPGHFIIGAGAALDKAAREVMWMKRQQTEKMSWQRTVFHVHESVRIARSMTEDVGPPADYVVLHRSGMLEIPPDCEPLARWSERFATDSSSLDGQEFKTELMSAARRIESTRTS